jgi:hypothetical protein
MRPFVGAITRSFSKRSNGSYRFVSKAKVVEDRGCVDMAKLVMQCLNAPKLLCGFIAEAESREDLHFSGLARRDTLRDIQQLVELRGLRGVTKL